MKITGIDDFFKDLEELAKIADDQHVADVLMVGGITIPNVGNPVVPGAKVESIVVDSENAYLLSEDGVLFSRDKTELITYPAAKTDASYTVRPFRYPAGGEHAPRCKRL